MQSMQERLHQNRRQKQHRSMLRLVMLLVVVVVLAGGWLFVRRPGVAFGDVTITGTKLFTRQDLVRLSGSQEPVNLFRMSRRQLVRSLKEDVRVADASASYGWGILRVQVVERKPMLYLANALNNYVKVDEHGLVLDIGSGIKDAAVPLYSGIHCGSAYIGDQIKNPEVVNVLAFMQGLSPEAREQISEIALDSGQKIQVRLKYGFPVQLGPVSEIGLKAKSELFMTVFDEIKDKHVKAKYIDLQYSKPFIKLQ